MLTVEEYSERKYTVVIIFKESKVFIRDTSLLFYYQSVGLSSLQV